MDAPQYFFLKHPMSDATRELVKKYCLERDDDEPQFISIDGDKEKCDEYLRNLGKFPAWCYFIYDGKKNKNGKECVRVVDTLALHYPEEFGNNRPEFFAPLDAIYGIISSFGINQISMEKYMEYLDDEGVLFMYLTMEQLLNRRI